MQNKDLEKSSRKLKSDREDWRIAYIPYGQEFKPMFNLGPLLGVIVFLAGAFLLVQSFQSKAVPTFYGYKADAKTVLMIMAGGWVFALVSVWSLGRQQRKAWVKIDAKCLDKEWRRVYTSDGDSWTFRLLCEFYFKGKQYRVTPGAYWTTFISENSLKKFLDKRIALGGHCQLYVNPKNPLQTEFVGQDIKDFLLH